MVYREVPNSDNTDEINIIDITNFLIKSKKLILLCGFVGFAVAIAYYYAVPKKFTATATIIPIEYSSLDKKISVYNGSQVKQRLEVPTVYTKQQFLDCNIDTDDNGLVLSQLLNVEEKKNSDLFSISVRTNSPVLAKMCLTSVISMLQSQQEKLKRPFILLMEQELAEINLQLENVKSILLGFQHNDIFTTSYFDKRIEQKELESKAYKLEKNIKLSRQTSLGLVSPIYAPNRPVEIHVGIQLFLGLILGLLVGVFFAFFKQFKNLLKTCTSE